MQDSRIDELDRRLVHALQIAPRAPWTRVAAVVGADAVTLARRWQRLRDDGLAWVTCHPPGDRAAGAVVEISTQPTALRQVLKEIIGDERAVSIDVTSGGRDIILTAMCRDQDDLSNYLLDRLGTLEGIAAISSHPVSAILTEGSQWRLQELDANETASLTAPAPRVRQRARRDVALEYAIADALAEDGRMGATELAVRLDAPQRRVRETIAELFAASRLVLRADIARHASGWPVAACFFLSVPAPHVERVGALLSKIREIRTVLSVVGRYNIVMTVWMRSITDVPRLEARIESQLQGVRIVDRSIILRTAKVVGTTLDDAGNARSFAGLRMFAADRPT